MHLDSIKIVKNLLHSFCVVSVLALQFFSSSGTSFFLYFLLFLDIWYYFILLFTLRRMLLCIAFRVFV